MVIIKIVRDNKRLEEYEEKCTSPLVGMLTGAATMEVSEKIKNSTTIWFSNSASGYLFQENENI